ncbi:MAG TPA: phytanoyl-CoA dioxygenase family protein [Thermoanaerobaculia bacterium]|nr:phytanoyl-CoA dioxygenase family protein [Thermoanaerobaculia bacterium]
MSVSPQPGWGYDVSPVLLENFRREGHVLLPHVASREEVARWKPVVERTVENVTGRSDPQGRIDDYSRLFTQVTNIWRIDPDAREIVFNRRFASIAAQLLGVPHVRLYHDQALFKPSGGARTPWHQDRYYWPLDTDLTVTMWLPLTDVTEEMGPMRFACGSHRARNLGDLVISEKTDVALEALIAARGWAQCSSPVRAGDASFHYGGTIHSAGANRSDSVRAVLTIIYFADGTKVAPPANEHQRVDLDVFLPGAQPGAHAATELNPLLF